MPDAAPGGDTFDGDCFTTSYRLQHALQPYPAKLVHGLPCYMRPGPDFGKRMWHAWVEIVKDGVPMVLDFANGREAALPRDDYYRVSDIQQVFRYTKAQADRHVDRTGHAGPWVDDWESYEHPDFHGVGIGTPVPPEERGAHHANDQG